MNPLHNPAVAEIVEKLEAVLAKECASGRLKLDAWRLLLLSDCSVRSVGSEATDDNRDVLLRTIATFAEMDVE